MAKFPKQKPLIVNADAYLGMKLGKAQRAEQALQKRGWKTRIVKRDQRYGEERYGIQVTFSTTGFGKDE